MIDAIKSILSFIAAVAVTAVQAVMIVGMLFLNLGIPLIIGVFVFVMIFRLIF